LQTLENESDNLVGIV